MEIAFDPLKDAANLAKHGVSLAMVTQFEWPTAVTWLDDRRDYGEPRQVGLGYVGDRLFAVVFVDRGAQRRVISLRKANRREECMYAET